MLRANNLHEIRTAGNEALPELAERLGLTLQKHDARNYKTREHDLLIISKLGRGFSWYSKGVQGDCFKFVQAYEGGSFGEALRKVSDFVGIKPEYPNEPKAKRPRRKLSNTSFSHERQKDKVTLTKQAKPKKTAKESDLAGLIEKAFLQSKDRPYTCTFTRWICTHFGHEGKQALERYGVTSASTGHTVFWLRNVQGRACRGVMIPYLDRGESVNRNKDGYTSSVQAKLAKQYGIKYEAESLENPCFGSHLLSSSPQTICIVEAPKTAVLATILAPKISGKPVLWLAVNGASLNPLRSLTSELHGKEVLLFPDEGQAHIWSEQAQDLASEGLNVSLVSTQSQRLGEKEDFADVLLREYFAAQNSKESTLESLGMALDSLEEGCYDLPDLHKLYAPNMALTDFVEVLQEWIQATGYRGTATEKYLVFRRVFGSF